MRINELKRVPGGKLFEMEVTESIIETGPNYVVEKKTRTVEEETIFVNGVPVQLAGPEADELKRCMLTGEIPTGLLERILGNAKLRSGTVAKVQTSLTVKKKMQTKDTVIEKNNGVVTDEHTTGTNEEQISETSQTDVYAPADAESRSIISSELFVSSYPPRPGCVQKNPQVFQPCRWLDAACCQRFPRPLLKCLIYGTRKTLNHAS